MRLEFRNRKLYTTIRVIIRETGKRLAQVEIRKVVLAEIFMRCAIYTRKPTNFLTLNLQVRARIHLWIETRVRTVN